jgi:hypothetical protein
LSQWRTADCKCAIHANRHPVDFLKLRGAIGEKPRRPFGAPGECIFSSHADPSACSGHMEAEQAIFRLQLDFRPAYAGALAFLSESAIHADVSVWRPIKFGHV